MKKILFLTVITLLIGCNKTPEKSSNLTLGSKEITLEEIWNDTFSPVRMNALNSMNGNFYSLLNTDKETNETTVDKYRMAFVKRLGDRLDNIPAEKLEQIAARIDTLIEKYENNENISDRKKEAMLSALMALKEIIDEKLEGDETTDEVIDAIEDLLN